MDDIKFLNDTLIVINKLIEMEYVNYKTVSDKLDMTAWQKVYHWFSEHDVHNRVRIVVVGSNQITKCNTIALNSLKEDIYNRLHYLYSEADEKELEHKIKEDTLKNNRVTRLISWLSLIISFVALILSIYKE